MPLYFRFVTKTEILKKVKNVQKKVKNVRNDILSEVLKNGYITNYNFICRQ